MSKEDVKEKEKLVAGPGWGGGGLTQTLTGRLTVGRNVTSTSINIIPIRSSKRVKHHFVPFQFLKLCL
jgi:hypothetical protein